MAVGALLIVLVIVGLLADDGEPNGSPADAEGVRETVQQIRDAESRAGFPNVQVEIDGNQVTLIGSVDTQSESDQAAAVARSVVGVTAVVVNQLSVEGSADSSAVAAPGGPATADDLVLQHRLSTLMAANPIVFESASAELAAESIARLDTLVAELNAAPGVRVLIGGHTDGDGEEAANLELSRLRAEAVVAYLVGAGIDAERLTAEGYGEAFPIASNETKEGKATNRRIEVLIQT